MVAVCFIQEIIYRIHLGEKLFGSLLQLHDRMHSWLFVRILPEQMVERSLINELINIYIL